MTALKDQVIEASAGAGKTTLLVQRYIDIFAENPHLNPKNVLAITFTKLAAAEMLNRMTQQQDKLPHNLAEALQDTWITTIHGFCHDLLKQHCPAALKKAQFDILEPDAQNLMIHRAIQESIQALTLKEEPALLAYLNTHTPHQLNFVLKKCFQMPLRLKAAFENALDTAACPLYESLALSQVAAEAHQELSQIAHIFLYCWDHFCELKTRSHSLDYDDLLMQSCEFLKQNPAARLAFQKNLHYIMVDEFQDTSALEWALIQQLLSDQHPFGHHKIFLVGDRWQSIYGFRGGDQRLFESLITEESGKSLVLKQDNYRSDPRIIQWVNCVFGKLSEKQAMPFRAITAHKAAKLEEALRFAILPSSERLGILDQLDCVIQDMKKLTPQIPYSEMAIILRKKKHAKHCQEALNSAGIPTRLQLGIALFQQPHIIALAHLIHLIYNPRQSNHFAAFILSGWLGLPKEQLILFKDILKQQLWATEPTHFKTFCESLKTQISETHIQRLIQFSDLINHFSNQIFKLTPRQLVVLLLDKLPRYDNIEDPALHQALLDHFLDKLSTWWQQSSKHPWLNCLELLAFHIAHPEKSQITLDDAAFAGVHILSIHAAKGLEFEAVYLLEIEAGFNYDASNPLLLSPEGKIGYSFQKNKVKNPLRSEIQPSVKAAIIQEEKHLFYVAATRAKSRLMICGSESKRKQDSVLNMIQSISKQQANHLVFEYHKDQVLVPLIQSVPQGMAELEPETLVKPSVEPEPKKNHIECSSTPFKKISFRHLFKKQSGITSQKSYEGTLMHQCLENACRYPFKALASLIPSHSKQTALCMQWLETFVSSDLYTQLLSCQSSLIEFPFQLIQQNLLVTARIDLALIFEDQRGLLIDFKSQAQEQFQSLYQQQLSLYALGLAQYYPEIHFDAALYWADKGTLSPVTVLGEAVWEGLDLEASFGGHKK